MVSLYCERFTALERFYFALSGVFAIFLYAFLLFFVAFLLEGGERLKIAINNPSALSSISVDIIDETRETPQDSKDSRDSPTPQDSPPKPKNEPSESPPKSALSGLGAGELFKKIDAKTPAIKDEISDNRAALARNAPDTKKLSEILQKTSSLQKALQNATLSIQDERTSRFCKKNAGYCKELSALLYSHWEIRDSFEALLSSRVAISISQNGAFSYTIEQQSGNEAFDTSLKNSLEKLKNITFPTLENTEISSLKVVFRNKKDTQ